MTEGLPLSAPKILEGPYQGNHMNITYATWHMT